MKKKMMIRAISRTTALPEKSESFLFETSDGMLLELKGGCIITPNAAGFDLTFEEGIKSCKIEQQSDKAPVWFYRLLGIYIGADTNATN